MTENAAGRKRFRRSYRKIPEVIEMPNLIEIQKVSYERFLRSGTGPEPTDGEGIQGVFQSVFPIRDPNGLSELHFLGYELEPPQFDVDECQRRDVSFAAPLKVNLRLTVFDVDNDSGARQIRNVKERRVYLGDIPLMTDNGTFIINGTERVVVSQMHRSPGVFFNYSTHQSGKRLYNCRILPGRGAWIDFEFNLRKDRELGEIEFINVRIDRKRKLLATTLLFALGMDQEEIMSSFYHSSTFRAEISSQAWEFTFRRQHWMNRTPIDDLILVSSGEVVAPAGRTLTASLLADIDFDGKLVRIDHSPKLNPTSLAPDMPDLVPNNPFVQGSVRESRRISEDGRYLVEDLIPARWNRVTPRFDLFDAHSNALLAAKGKKLTPAKFRKVENLDNWELWIPLNPLLRQMAPKEGQEDQDESFKLLAVNREAPVSTRKVSADGKFLVDEFVADRWQLSTPKYDIVEGDTGKKLVRAGKKVTRKQYAALCEREGWQLCFPMEMFSFQTTKTDDGSNRSSSVTLTLQETIEVDSGESLTKNGKYLLQSFESNSWQQTVPTLPIIQHETDAVVCPANRKITAHRLRMLEKYVGWILCRPVDPVLRMLTEEDYLDPETESEALRLVAESGQIYVQPEQNIGAGEFLASGRGAAGRVLPGGDLLSVEMQRRVWRFRKPSFDIIDPDNRKIVITVGEEINLNRNRSLGIHDGTQPYCFNYDQLLHGLIEPDEVADKSHSQLTKKVAADPGYDLNMVTGLGERCSICACSEGVSLVANHVAGRTRWVADYSYEDKAGTVTQDNLIDRHTGEQVLTKGARISRRLIERWKQAGRLLDFETSTTNIIGRFIARDLIDEENGVVLAEAGDEITGSADANENPVDGLLKTLIDHGYTEIPVLDIDYVNVGPYMRDTMVLDRSYNRETGLLEVYRVIRPGDPPVLENALELFNQMLHDPERYDLSAVGRVKMNERLALDVSDSVRVLRKEDIVACLQTLLALRNGDGEIDDIDHLGNRRVRSVGELMEDQCRIGLVRMERAVRERMATVEIDKMMPQDLINARPVFGAVREFFGSSQLSQFMDQTNPLSEITHKRRLSALGPGGLTRERAGFEVRDVHPTHYGRICPVETPEGQNIGLINSLATFSKVNRYGFIETPYRMVHDGKLSDDVLYVSAMEEANKVIAQANARVDEDGNFVNELISTRSAGEFKMNLKNTVDMIDVSPMQLVSVAASLIPFLENDDANRALMGSNMQRQAVPLIKAEAPFVGTGIESVVAKDSGAAIVARRGGIVDQVDANRIVISAHQTESIGDPGVDTYRLRKFQRSNQNTCINQHPLVKVGDVVSANEVIADGPSTDLGELALGRNILVAFMPWNGYNFEDSVLVSERLVIDDVFTSVHIEEHSVSARDTKLGPEEITRDIPNLGEEALRNLDEAGVIYLGAEVAGGDILVGKITPKGETPMTPEEKLLRAIFGEKASDVRDTSLRLPPGDSGTVVEVRIFNRHGIAKCDRTLQIESEEIARLQQNLVDELAILSRTIYNRLHNQLLGQTVARAPKPLKRGTQITPDGLASLERHLWWRIAVSDDQAAKAREQLEAQYTAQREALEARCKDKIEKAKRGDDLPPGVLRIVKVYVAVKRKLQAGDKMAGRHGNKGVVSKVVPIEDMPFLADGTPVDIVLNPLGVPSRMNIGQILETHMGWASRGLARPIDDALRALEHNGASAQIDEQIRNAMRHAYGDEAYASNFAAMSGDAIVASAASVRHGVPIETPVFDGVEEAEIDEALLRAGFDETGQSELYDGLTGEKFARPVTVGIKYMLKLHHLVDDKIHARSTGPYSLVTQQPLGGKAQFGGQRFGEMEVWALEAYGAAHILQEMLTVKADDVAGRTKVYDAIVKGENTCETGIPESFNVLVREVRGLCLNMELRQSHTGK